MSDRRSIRAPDIPDHINPIPAATTVGNMLFTSAIGGEDPETHVLPADKEEQIANTFKTINAIMRESGGTVEDIAKVSVYVADRDDRKLINPHWLKMFPDENSRPVRHTSPRDLPAGRHIQLEFIAVLK